MSVAKPNSFFGLFQGGFEHVRFPIMDESFGSTRHWSDSAIHSTFNIFSAAPFTQKLRQHRDVVTLYPPISAPLLP